MPRSFTRRVNGPTRVINASDVNELQIASEEDDVRIDTETAARTAADLVMTNDLDTAENAIARVDPGVAGTVGQVLTKGLSAPTWAQDVYNVRAFGAIGDSASHPLSERYATLAAAQAVYPFVTALTQQIDWAAIQLAMNTAGANIPGTYSGWMAGAQVYLPVGVYMIQQRLVQPRSVILSGAGIQSSRIQVLSTYTDTFMVQMGKELEQYEAGMWITHMTLDCGGLAGVGGVTSRTANEPNGLSNVLVRNYMARPLYFYSSASPVLNSSHIVIEDCMFFVGINATGAHAEFSNVFNTVILRRTSFTSMSSGAATNEFAVKASDCNVVIEGCHVERHLGGTQVTFGTGSKGGLLVLSMTGHSTVQRLISIIDTTPHVVLNARSVGAAKTIENTVSGENLVFTVPFYTNKPLISTGTVFKKAVNILTASLQVTTAYDLIEVDATATLVTVSFPAAAACKGHEFIVKKIDASANAVQANPPGTDLIDGMDRKSITSRYGFIRCISNGVGFDVVGGGGTIVDVP